MNTRRGVIRVFAAGVCAAMIFSFSSAAGAANADVQKYRDRISELEGRQKELEDKIASLDSRAGGALENKRSLDMLTEAVEQKIAASEALNRELAEQIRETEDRADALEISIGETREKMKERLRDSQDSGGAGYLQVLFGSVSVSDFLSRLERINTVLEYDRRTAERLEADKQSLSDAAEELKSAKALQEKTLSSLEADREKYGELSQRAESYYDSLSKDREALQREYDAARRAESELESELEALLSQIKDQNSSPVSADGDYMWPLPAGVGYITCRYGETDPKGDPHWALDTAAPAGTPIYASNDGTVVRAMNHSSYGNFILIDHGGGISTLYAHCSSLAVCGGQTVTRGQVIGYVGTTGFSKGNHLHFELRVNGVKKDPLAYVSPAV